MMKNMMLSEIRVVVENSIGKIKNWKVLAGKYRHFSYFKNDSIEIDDVFKVCVLLTNYFMKKKPLRIESWKPKSFQNECFFSIIILI